MLFLPCCTCRCYPLLYSWCCFLYCPHFRHCPHLTSVPYTDFFNMRYVNLRLFYFLFQRFRLPVHSCNIPADFVERFVCIFIWNFFVYRDASAVFKNIPFFCFSDRAIASTCFIIIVGVSTSVNCLRVIFFLEHSKKKL